jgi:hypothetical protein
MSAAFPPFEAGPARMHLSVSDGNSGTGAIQVRSPSSGQWSPVGFLPTGDSNVYRRLGRFGPREFYNEFAIAHFHVGGFAYAGPNPVGNRREIYD